MAQCCATLIVLCLWSTGAATQAPAYAVDRVVDGDTVVLATMAGGLRAFLRASGGMNQFRESCRAMSEGPFAGPANLGKSLHELAARTGRRGIVFVFSDLLDDVPEILAGLQHVRYHKHEVVLFHVLDGAELDFPFRHTTLFRGLEGLPEILTDPLGIRESYLKSLGEE